MDRQARRMVTQRGEEQNSDHAEASATAAQSDSDNEEKHDTVNQIFYDNSLAESSFINLN